MVVGPAMLFDLETVALKKRQKAELKRLKFFFEVVMRMDRMNNEYNRGKAWRKCQCEWSEVV